MKFKDFEYRRLAYEDLKKEYDRMAEMYSMSADEVKQYVPEETLADDLKLQKALDLLKK